MKKCSYPGCGFIGELITNAHCKINHGITRKELTRKYGEPKSLSPKDTVLMGKKLKQARGY